MFKYKSGVNQVIMADLDRIDHDVMVTHLKIRTSLDCLERPCVDICRDYLSSLTHQCAEPVRYRTSTRAHLETAGTQRNIERADEALRALIEQALCGMDTGIFVCIK